MGKKVVKFYKKGAGLGALKRYFNPKIPQPPEANAAPVADDALTSIANERLMANRRKGGRGSTILSESSKLG